MGFWNALKSKTVWGAVALTAIHTLPVVAPAIQALPYGNLALTLGLGAFTIYGRIRAKQPLGPVIDATIAQTVDAVRESDRESPSLPKVTAPEVAPIVKDKLAEAKK